MNEGEIAAGTTFGLFVSATASASNSSPTSESSAGSSSGSGVVSTSTTSSNFGASASNSLPTSEASSGSSSETGVVSTSTISSNSSTSTSQTSDPSSTSHSSLGGGGIAGIAIGSIVGMVIIGLLVWNVFKKPKRPDPPQPVWLDNYIPPPRYNSTVDGITNDPIPVGGEADTVSSLSRAGNGGLVSIYRGTTPGNSVVSGGNELNEEERAEAVAYHLRNIARP